MEAFERPGETARAFARNWGVSEFTLNAWRRWESWLLDTGILHPWPDDRFDGRIRGKSTVR